MRIRKGPQFCTGKRSRRPWTGRAGLPERWKERGGEAATIAARLRSMHGRTSSSRPITPRLLVEAVDVVDSTNSELLRREPLLPSGSPAEAIWLVANRQTAGR